LVCRAKMYGYSVTRWEGSMEIKIEAIKKEVSNRMKKCSPSYGQNDQLVHWWVLIHSDPLSIRAFKCKMV